MAKSVHVDTMEALVLERPGRIRLSRIPVPEPGPGELLVRVKAATTCGTDLKAFLRGHPQIPMPGPFGHEYSGTVVKAGKNAAIREGEDVMGVHSAPCKKCKWCRRGQENLCDSIMATKVLGTYSEYIVIPSRIADCNVYAKPEWLSFERAAFLEPLACVAHALELADPHPMDDVLVIGPGAIGLMFVIALRHMGFERITLAGRNPARLAVGASLGACTVPYSEHRGRHDLVIECTGNPDVWESSLGHVERGGTLLLFGGCPSGTTAAFDTRRLHYDQLRVLSPFHFGTKSVKHARSWLLDPLFDVSPILNGERRLHDAEAVFRDLEAGVGIRYVFHP